MGKSVNPIGDATVKDFLEKYDKLGDLEKALEKLPVITKETFEMTAYLCAELIFKKAAGINNVTAEDILPLTKYKAIYYVYGKMYTEYESLILKNLGEDAYRKMRKESRARIIGGGFGITGAVEGMAIAGLANTATGVVHSIFNGISGVISKQKLNFDLIDKHRAYRGELADAVGYDCEQLMQRCLDVINSSRRRR